MESIIDIDVHEQPRSMDEFVSFLEPQWRRYIVECGWRPEYHRPHSQLTVGGVYRADAIPMDGSPAGSDVEIIKSQLLDQYGLEAAVLTGWVNFNASAMAPTWPEFKTALMSAYNDWQVANILSRDDRFWGSIHVNAHDPVGAVKEINRLAAHPKMVQVMIYIGTELFGQVRYHEIFRVASEHGLPVALHHGANTPTAYGYHSYYIEWHTLVPQAFMSQLVSLVCNGVLDRYPTLKVVMVEGGFSYIPHLLWRLDQQYRQLRVEVPWVLRRPSESIREQVFFATQPIEEVGAAEVERIVEQIGTEDRLCFSSDYPHWDFDSPQEAIPAGVSENLKRKILHDNAVSLYSKIKIAS